MKKTALFYVTDLKGYNLTIHALASFVLTQEAHYDIFLFCHNFTPNDVEIRKKQCAQHGFSLNVSQITNEEISNIPTKGHVTPAAYLKLLCVLTLKDRYERVLYADNDILFFEQLNLTDFNFNGLPLAAVIDVADAGGVTDPTFAQTCLEHGVSNKYFNAGLMFFNCIELRADSTLEKKYFEYLRQHQKFCWYKKCCNNNDQCVVNKLFDSKWAPLPINYNMQACLKYTGYWSKPLVRHYQGRKKFIPVVIWRDDIRGIKMVRRAQQFLQMNVTPLNSLGVVFYWMNALRQWKSFLMWRRVLKKLRIVYGDNFVKFSQSKKVS